MLRVDVGFVLRELEQFVQLTRGGFWNHPRNVPHSDYAM